MKKILVLAFFALLSISFSYAQSDKEYRKALKTMLEVSGYQESFQVAVKQVIEVFRQNYPGIAANTWSELEKEFSAASMDELVDMLAPVYAHHLSQEDLEQVVAFYQSPAGKKYSEKTPLIMHEAIAVGEQWGEKIGQKLERKLRAGTYQ